MTTFHLQKLATQIATLEAELAEARKQESISDERNTADHEYYGNLEAEWNEERKKILDESTSVIQQNTTLRTQRDDLLTGLKLIADMAGKTLLGPDSTHHLGEGAPCYHEMGSNAAFERAAEVARTVIDKAKEQA